MLFLELALLLDKTEGGINSIFADSVILTEITTRTVHGNNTNIRTVNQEFTFFFCSTNSAAVQIIYPQKEQANHQGRRVYFSLSNLRLKPHEIHSHN